MTGRHGAAQRWPARLAGVLCLVLFAFILRPSEAQAVVDFPDGRLQWTVWREGDKIGTYVMMAHHVNGDLIVENEIQIVVRLIIIPVYRYVHRDQEIWHDGRLVHLTAFTNNNDESSSLELSSENNTLVVDGPVGRFYAPSTIFPSSLWKIDMTQGNTLLDVESGNLLAVKFSQGAEEPLGIGPGGADVSARHISVSGDLSRELWYGADGLLAQEQFAGPDGSTLTFRLDHK